jgi:hypothetical protein
VRGVAGFFLEGETMKRTSLYIKLAPEHSAKRKRAAAYKRTFSGICGGLTWRELARIAGAGRPKAIKQPGRDCLARLARIGRNLTRRAAR